MAGEGEHEQASTEELFESILNDVAVSAFEGHTEDEIERVVASGRLGEALHVWRDDIFGPLFPLS